MFLSLLDRINICPEHNQPMCQRVEFEGSWGTVLMCHRCSSGMVSEFYARELREVGLEVWEAA